MDICKGSTKQLNELIDHKCRQLGKTKTSKGGAMHLAEWMKGQLGHCAQENGREDKVAPEPEPEIWSAEELKRRTTQLQVTGYLSNRNESRCEDIDLASERSVSRNTEVSQQSFSPSESLTTVKSNHVDKPVSVCRQCRDTCLKAEAYEDDDFDDTWGSILCGMGRDPFTTPTPPAISVLPATPDRHTRGVGLGSPKMMSGLVDKSSSAPCSPIPTITRPHSRISEIIEGEEDEDTPDGSLQSSELDPPYRTLSSSLRRYGTLNSLEQVGSDEVIDDDKSEDDEKDFDDEEAEVTQRETRYRKCRAPSPPTPPHPLEQRRSPDGASGPLRSGKTYPEVIQPVRSWVSPAEVASPVRGWTARAGSFVAEKMALFERLSTGDTTTVRKTTFLERYLKPGGDVTNPDSPPDQGTNTSSSGRGEDEGETSGATSGEEVWGTPTSGGEFDEELVGESAALSFMDSPHGSIGGTDDDTDQLMEDLLISLPMLAARAPGVPPRRRLEPLPEEDDTDGSSAPCSPKPLSQVAAEQGRASSVYQAQHHDNCPEFGKSSIIRPLGNRKDPPPRPRIGTIDRALGIQSDEEDGEEEEAACAKPPSSPSILHRLGLRRYRDEGRKSNRLLGFLSGKKEQESSARNSAAYGGRPLFKYLFNRDAVDDIPTTLPESFNEQRNDGKQMERRFWKQLRRRRSSSTSLLPSRSPQVAI